jgi:hypothetical protein
MNMAGYAGEDIIIYNVQVWDFHNNTARAPTTGNFNITLLDIDETETEEEEKDDEGFLQAFMLNIIILVIVIVIIAIILFFFIRKQGEKIDQDRHKLRMAIADVEEAAGGKLPSTPDAAQPMDTLEPLPSLDGTAGVPGAPGYTEPQQLPPGQMQTIDIAPGGVPPGQPAPEPSAAPAYLPEAPQQPLEPDQDYLAYQDAGPAAPPEPQVQPEVQPQVEPTLEQQPAPEPAPETTPAPVPEPAGDAVKIDDGLSVSLPEETADGETPKPEVKKTDTDSEQS